jgi:hypothetical protein
LVKCFFFLKLFREVEELRLQNLRRRLKEELSRGATQAKRQAEDTARAAEEEAKRRRRQQVREVMQEAERMKSVKVEMKLGTTLGFKKTNAPAKPSGIKHVHYFILGIIYLYIYLFQQLFLRQIPKT